MRPSTVPPQTPDAGRPPEQEAARPMREIGIPSEAPENPYRERAGLTTDGGGPLSDPTAKGLDGDALDSLLKSRFIEGKRMGYDQGHEAARQRYPDIFDEGFRLGASQFVDVGRSVVARALLPAMENAKIHLLAIRKVTSSETVKKEVDAAIESLQEGHNQL